jgi:hypothetical protein
MLLGNDSWTDTVLSQLSIHMLTRAGKFQIYRARNHQVISIDWQGTPIESLRDPHWYILDESRKIVRVHRLP